MSLKLPEIFKRFEAELKEEIKSNDDPLLCLFVDSMGETTKALLVKELRFNSNPLQCLIENLWYFPSLLSILIIDRLLKGVGQNGYFEVYPILEEMLGTSVQSTNLRNDLWQGFRRACISLGIEVSARKGGNHYMVEDYLRQAGLPIAYVGKFTEKAVRYASEVGLPEEDDDEALALWQRGLVDRLNAPFPLVAKKAIERDNLSYYSKIFTRLCQNNPHDSSGLSLLEKTIFEELNQGSRSRKFRHLSIPEIVIRDLEYGILLPAGKVGGDRWVIDVDGEEATYTTNGEDRFVPFPPTLGKRIVVKRGETLWSHGLWEDNKNNRFLIFSLPTGRLTQGASLAESVILDPGDYGILLRFKPTDEANLEAFSDVPELYLRKISISPGTVHSLQRGPAKTLLCGNDISALTWGQKPLRGVRGNEFLPSKNLSIHANIPQEYLEKSRQYSLTLRSGSLGNNIDIDFDVLDGNCCEIDLEEHLKSWKPGVSRIVIELHMRGSLKTLARKSAIVWNGLFETARRIIFNCSSMPENLDQANCINVKVDQTRKLLTFIDDTNRFFKFSFIDGQITRHFSWTVPGVFVNLLTYREEGVEERSLRLGSILPVSKTSRKNVQIFASFPATLKLGNYTVDVDFSRIGSKILPLASLLEYTRAGDSSLLLINNKDGSITPLVELVTPSTVENFSLQTENGESHANFKTMETIQGLKITAVNMVNGERNTVKFESNDGEKIEASDVLPGIKVSSHFVNLKEVSCYFSKKCWPEGLWLISYQLKINSRWGVTMTKNSEEIVDSVLSSKVDYLITPQEMLQTFCDNTSIERKVEALVNIHKAMMSRFAEECWPKVSWLKTYWNTICTRYVQFAEKRELWGDILRLATEWPEEAIAEGHVTTSILNGYLLTMFCFDRSFVPVKGKINNSFLSCMASFPKLGDINLLLRDQIIDVSVLLGFNNAAAAGKIGERPKKFSIQNYYKALENVGSEDTNRMLLDDHWLPAKGTFLSSLHYRYALKQLRHRYIRSLSVASERRGRVLSIAKQMKTVVLSRYTKDIPFEGIINKFDLGLFTDKVRDVELLTDQDVVTQEHLENIIRSISFIAQVCRAQARLPGILSAFIKDIQHKCDMSNNQIYGNLGYLLFLGEDLFAFYLMLWEVVFSAEITSAEEEAEKTRKRRRIYVRN